MKLALQIKSPKAIMAFTTTLIIFGAGSYLLGWSSVLTVKQIEITGAPTLTSEKEITKSLNLSIGDKLARVSSKALSNRLKANAWVESADISRNWFNGKVAIEIHPRVPVALYTELG